jgi:hypothetical protein
MAALTALCAASQSVEVNEGGRIQRSEERLLARAQQLRQLGDIRPNPPRLGRMYAGRGLISLHNKAAGSQIKTGSFRQVNS